jgi:hypothetical protein
MQIQRRLTPAGDILHQQHPLRKLPIWLCSPLYTQFYYVPYFFKGSCLSLWKDVFSFEYILQNSLQQDLAL